MCKIFGDIYYFILTRFDPIWPAVWPFMKKFFKQNIIVFGRSFHNNIFSTFWDTDDFVKWFNFLYFFLESENRWGPISQKLWVWGFFWEFSTPHWKLILPAGDIEVIFPMPNCKFFKSILTTSWWWWYPYTFMKKYFKQNIFVLTRSNSASNFITISMILTIDYFFWFFLECENRWGPIFQKLWVWGFFWEFSTSLFETNLTWWWHRHHISKAQLQIYQIYTDHLMMMIPKYFLMKPHY